MCSKRVDDKYHVQTKCSCNLLKKNNTEDKNILYIDTAGRKQKKGTSSESIRR